MGLLLALFGLQLVAVVAGFALLWRKLDSAGSEIARLRAQLEEQAAGGARYARVGNAGVVERTDAPPLATPTARAAKAWNLRRRSVPLSGPTLTPETGRALMLAAAAIAPSFGFFVGVGSVSIVAIGLMIAAGMILTSLRPAWRVGAWTAAVTAIAWALVGFGSQAAQTAPLIFAICTAIAATCGMAHAHLRRAGPGIALASAMAVAVLTLGTQIGMVSPAGAAFGLMVAIAAIVGATTFRLEPLHVGAFAASLLGLFVLSGQPSAAIWFTPAATWAGALFLAIAAVRVPQLGARGGALALTGALAPFASITALHVAQHGLADNYAAACAYLVLAGVLAAITALGALRRGRGVAAMRFSLYVLVAGAFVSLAGAVITALPIPLEAPAFALIAVGLLGLDLRIRNTIWRVFAIVAGLAALVYAGLNAQLLLDETAQWPDRTIILAGLAAPAVISGGAALLAQRGNAPATAALFEIITFALGVASADLFTRLAFSGGATLLEPIGFVEIAMHCVVWLVAALLIGSRAHLGARGVRNAAINLLTLMAFATMAFASGLWLAAFWGSRAANNDGPLLSHDTMGFVLPAILFWAHWVFWRARGAQAQTRISLAAGAFLLAAFFTVEAMRAEHWPEWAGALVGALTFSLAIVINFAPGVVHADAPLKARGRSPSQSVRRAAP